MKARARLKQRLRARGISQARIAAAAACTRTSVYYFLTGRLSTPSIVTAVERLLAADQRARVRAARKLLAAVDR